jgi:hypothetical protein
VGLTDDNAIAISQSGRFVLRVENAMLVVYEWSGSGMSMTWQRRCQLAAADGYTFRTSEWRACEHVACKRSVLRDVGDRRRSAGARW